MYNYGFDKGYTNLPQAIVMQIIRDYEAAGSPRKGIDINKVMKIFDSDWYITLCEMDDSEHFIKELLEG